MQTPNTYPQPRFDETIEVTLESLLTTEAQADRDAEQLAAMADWLKESN